MLSNIEITIADRDWPTLQLVLREGPRVVVESARFDQAEQKFSATITNFIKQSLTQIQQNRRKHGS